MVSIGESCLSSTENNNRIVSIVKESYDNLDAEVRVISFPFGDVDARRNRPQQF
jgi:hypothetical protein